MEKQFVTYEIALKLKELGFDRECFGIFSGEKLIIQGEWLYSTNSETMSETTNPTAPLWQQAIQWIWSYHKILIHTHLVPGLPKTILWAVESDHIDYWGTQEEAVLQALELCAKRR